MKRVRLWRLSGFLGSAALLVGGCGRTNDQDEDSTDNDCGVVQLADVAQGIGGFVVDGESEEDFSGSSVSVADDVNGDGIADVVVGAEMASPNGYHSGRAYVVFGREESDEVWLGDVAQGTGGFALDGEAEGQNAGSSASGAGDVNGDGLADVLVGAELPDEDGNSSGRAYVVFGNADTQTISLANVVQGIGGFAVDGETDWPSSSFKVSGAGDVNGDGLADVIAGAPRTGPNGPYSGRTYVVFGKPDTDTVDLADVAQGVGGFALDGEAEGDQSGWSVSGAGDVNGDSLPDVVVAAGMASPNGLLGAGRSYVIFGKPDTDIVQLADVAQGIGGFALDGEAAGDFSGWSVGGAGDVNDDGLADVVVGAPRVDSNGRDSGRTYVVFGKADTDIVLLLDVAQGVGGFALDGEAEGDYSGEAVGGGVDVTGDGLDDVIIGAHKAAPNGLLSGRTYVVFGKADTKKVQLQEIVRGVGGFVLDGEAELDWSGGSVDAGGDINGDGVAEVVVGAAWADPTGPESGRTYVVFGGDFSCASGRRGRAANTLSAQVCRDAASCVNAP